MMSSEALRLNEDVGALARVAVRGARRTLVIESHPAPGIADSETIWVPYSRETAIDTLKEVAVEYQIDRIRLALSITRCSLLDPVCVVARELGLEVSAQFRLTSDLPQTGASAAQEIAFDFFRHPSNHFPGSFLKRLVDIIGAGAVLAFLSPLMLILAIAVKATSSGPVFFLQPRIGRRCRIFRMVKFRTMVADAEALRRHLAHMNSARGISFKVIDDPRLTKLGRILRRTSLDELPQLFNVLKGDMSLVGPRPIPTWVAEQLCDTRYHRRFSVLPGMTGLWQVRGRRQDFDYMAERDLEYTDRWSVWLDLKLLAATPLAVVRGEGAH